MPTTLHEVLIDLFRSAPLLAPTLLADVCGVAVPAGLPAGVAPDGFTDVAPTEYRADTVIVLGDPARPELGLVLEVQLGRDPDKRFSWPVYLATLRARSRCPVYLLVFCIDESVARWCARPIEFGHPGLRLVPLVVGPREIPVLVDPAAAVAAPELAVLSAMAHGGDPAHRGVLDAFVASLSSVESDRSLLYSDLVLALLPVVAKEYLEGLLTSTYEFQSDFARRYFSAGRVEGEAEGEARGEARAVLAVLDARGIEVPEVTRQRIRECTDLAQLDDWVRRAATASSVDELFA